MSYSSRTQVQKGNVNNKQYIYNDNTVNKTIHLTYFIPYYRLYLLIHFPQIVLYGEKKSNISAQFF